jgi:hypothetical protein
MRRSGVRIPLPPEIRVCEIQIFFIGDENLVRPVGRGAQGYKRSSKAGANAKRWIIPLPPQNFAQAKISAVLAWQNSLTDSSFHEFPHPHENKNVVYYRNR